MPDQAHAGEAGVDMRTGLAALAQAWLDDVALPRFRWPADTPPVALGAWFGSPQALLYIKVPAWLLQAWCCWCWQIFMSCMSQVLLMWGACRLPAVTGSSTLDPVRSLGIPACKGILLALTDMLTGACAVLGRGGGRCPGPGQRGGPARQGSRARGRRCEDCPQGCAGPGCRPRGARCNCSTFSGPGSAGGSGRPVVLETAPASAWHWDDRRCA